MHFFHLYFWGPTKSYLKSHFITFWNLGPLKIGGPRQMSTLPIGEDGSEPYRADLALRAGHKKPAPAEQNLFFCALHICSLGAPFKIYFLC